MTYLGLLEVLETAARTVDADATYIRGRLSDVSLNSHDAANNIIYTLDTMQAEPDTDNRLERWNIRIGFFRQDSTSSESMESNQVQGNEESRETIFNKTIILARAFYDALLNEEELMLTGTPRYSQLTREFQGTYTGWGLDVSVLLEVGCDSTEIQDGVYKNSDSTFVKSIKRGETYTAPDITVTDSTGDVYELPANKDVVCAPGGSGGTDNYEVYVDSVLVDSGSITFGQDKTINIDL